MNKRTTEQANIISDHATPHPTKSAQNITTKATWHVVPLMQRTQNNVSQHDRQHAWASPTISQAEPPSACANHHITPPCQHHHSTIQHHASHRTRSHSTRCNHTKKQSNGTRLPNSTHTHTHTHTHTTHHSIPHQVTTKPHRTCMPTINRAKPPQQNAPDHKTPSS